MVESSLGKEIAKTSACVYIDKDKDKVCAEACWYTSTKTSVIPKRAILPLYRCSSVTPGVTSPFGIEVMNVT